MKRYCIFALTLLSGLVFLSIPQVILFFVKTAIPLAITPVYLATIIGVQHHSVYHLENTKLEHQSLLSQIGYLQNELMDYQTNFFEDYISQSKRPIIQQEMFSYMASALKHIDNFESILNDIPNANLRLGYYTLHKQITDSKLNVETWKKASYNISALASISTLGAVACSFYAPCYGAVAVTKITLASAGTALLSFLWKTTQQTEESRLTLLHQALLDMKTKQLCPFANYLKTNIFGDLDRSIPFFKSLAYSVTPQDYAYYQVSMNSSICNTSAHKYRISEFLKQCE